MYLFKKRYKCNIIQYRACKMIIMLLAPNHTTFTACTVKVVETWYLLPLLCVTKMAVHLKYLPQK